ncbi:MAG: hypothetical protein ABSH20_29210 [Tepidisphaeraceae bacterium]
MTTRQFLPLLAVVFLIATALLAAEPAKEDAPSGRGGAITGVPTDATTPGGDGERFTLTNEAVRVPVVVVKGTPYQMGWHLGRLMKNEIQQLAPAVVERFKKELGLSDETLDQVWATTARFTDARVLQQIAGLAQGSGVPVRTLQHVHCLPLLMPYSCSSIAGPHPRHAQLRGLRGRALRHEHGRYRPLADGRCSCSGHALQHPGSTLHNLVPHDPV